jgi:hypothetical protein
MVTNEELSRALLDVRKAYRLLYLFQQRIMDLVAQLSGTLGQTFWYWLPSGDDEAILGSKNPVERSTWKMLPLFGASFLFLPPGVDPSSPPRKGQWLLEVLLYLDDGQPDGGRREPNPVEFLDPAMCHSPICVFAFIVQEDIQGEWWRNVYKCSEWPEEDGVAETNSHGICVASLSSDLAALPDAASVSRLAERFRKLVIAQGGSCG